MVDTPETLLSAGDTPDRTLAVVDSEQPSPVLDLFDDTFGALDIDIDRTTRETDIDADDAVVLLEEDDVVATSSMESIRNAVLLVNSDLYTTGLSGIEQYDAPEVLTELDEAVYTLRGFPASTKEKLLLIVMSRYIERRALRADDGRLDVAFQELSRIEDEYGTGRIYRRLADSDVEVHLYGVPDSAPVDLDGLWMHTGRNEAYRRSWFVVFSPPDDGIDPAALFAVETDRNVWRSMWTYDPDRVTEIRRYIDRNF
jgi:hypothetical protein